MPVTTTSPEAKGSLRVVFFVNFSFNPFQVFTWRRKTNAFFSIYWLACYRVITLLWKSTTEQWCPDTFLGIWNRAYLTWSCCLCNVPYLLGICSGFETKRRRNQIALRHDKHEQTTSLVLSWNTSGFSVSLNSMRHRTNYWQTVLFINLTSTVSLLFSDLFLFANSTRDFQWDWDPDYL